MIKDAIIRVEVSDADSLGAGAVTSVNSKVGDVNLSFSDLYGMVPSSKLPSYVDDVLEFDSTGVLPSPGEGGKIYLITGNNSQKNYSYRWGGSSYINIGNGEAYPASNPSGFITGVNLSNYVTTSQTGNFITNSQTGNFITNSQTGQFYPASNPSGFTTGVPALPTNLVYTTGDQNISGKLTSYFSNGNIQIPLGFSNYAYVRNLDSALTKGEVVYIAGAQGDRAAVRKASNTGEATSSKTFGIAAEAIASSADGYVINNGQLQNLNILTSFNIGDSLWLGTGAGSITNQKPTAPNHSVFLGVVEKPGNGNNGIMYVKIQNGYELDELHDVKIDSPLSGQFLVRNDVNSLWINKNIDFSNTQIFTSNNTWYKPTGAKSVDVSIIGGGGGGGAGRYDSVSTSRGGGGGGGGGGFTFLNLNASTLPDSILVTVGLGGSGALAQTVIGNNGANGNPGGSSSFGIYGLANGGAGGAGGSNATTSISSGGLAMFSGSAGGAGAIGVTTAKNGSSSISAGGGGGGGGCSSSNVNSDGGIGGTSTILTINGGTAGATNGGNGGTGGSVGVNQSLPGAGGGGGGGANSSTKGGDGGDGGIYGGGGGGGAGSNASSSGKGGNGAQGIVMVTTYF
jgi:hypothetical protein